MSPEQEQRVCDAPVNLGWLGNDHALHGEGVPVIRELLEGSSDDAKADASAGAVDKTTQRVTTRRESSISIRPFLM